MRLRLVEGHVRWGREVGRGHGGHRHGYDWLLLNRNRCDDSLHLGLDWGLEVLHGLSISHGLQSMIKKLINLL